ncbi:hypothetical protein Tco_0848268 [Tanacetum coccineum]
MARILVRPPTPLSPSIEARIVECVATPTSPSPLSPLSSPLPLIPSPPLLLPSLDSRGIIPEADMPPRKRACFTTPSLRFEIGESSTAIAAREPVDSEEFYMRHQDAQDDRALLQAQSSTLQRERRSYIYGCRSRGHRMDDDDKFIMHIQDDRARDLERARDPDRHDGLADAGSSC